MQSSSPAAISLALFLWSLLGPTATARAEDFHASRKLLDAAPQCSRAGQFVADATTACKSFWQCTGPGQGSYQSCGSGTAFDSGCSCCNFPSAFTCSSTPASANIAASPSPPSNPVPTSPPPASPASSNPSAGSPPSASSCTAANQFVPDTAVGCAKFWQCTGPQQGVYQSCNTGLIFDTSCNCCNFPSSSNCKAASPSTSSPSSQPSTGVPASPSPSSTTPTPSGSGIGSFVTADLFGQIFKHTNDAVCQHPNFYTYQSFTSAAGAFPGFGTSKDAATNKREVAAFLAQISHETTGGPASNNDYSWGLCFDEERTSDPYCDQSSQCAPGVSYHGRGPIQLSWNYNYGPAGSALGFDGINNPGAVLSDATLAWKTAIRFWMTAAGNKPSCHDVMNGNWQPSSADSAAGRLPGFGTVTNVINGGIECGPGRTNSAGGPDRIAYFQRYVYLLGTDAGANLSCDNQQHF